MHIASWTVHSTLGSWAHAQCRPVGLEMVVDHLWHFAGSATLPRERVFPAPILEIILHLGPRFFDVGGDGVRGERFPIACVGGLQTKAAVVEAPGGRVSVLGIRLHPVGAYRLFGRPLDATTGFTIDLLDLVGPDGPDLAARCFDAATVEARFRIVIEWIERRMARAARPNAGIAWAVARLERSSGAVSIGELVNGSNITPARFISLFTQHVGLPPKRYGRLLRFRHALDLLQGDSKLSDVALSAGYYDQPHLNADFREFAGMTPTAFINARRYPNSSSMQEPG